MGTGRRAPIAERIQAIREAHAAAISTWVKLSPAAYPTQLIEVVELLRADVDAWKIGSPPPGEPPPQAIAGRRPGFVDADTALAYLHHMVERGLSDRLHETVKEMDVATPDSRRRWEDSEAIKDDAKAGPRKGASLPWSQKGTR